MTTTQGGAPEEARRLAHVGQVVICPAHLADPRDAWRIRFPEACGRARVEALRAWRAGTLAPRLAAWIVLPEEAPRRATPADVDWTGSATEPPR